MKGNVLILIAGAIFLLALMIGAIITVIKTRNKSSLTDKMLYYTGIAVFIIALIYSLPLWYSFIKYLLVIGLIAAVVIWFYRK